jgi:hypothetical protein
LDAYFRHEVRGADTFVRLHFSNAEMLDVTPHHIFTLVDGSPMRAVLLVTSANEYYVYIRTALRLPVLALVAAAFEG